MSSLVPFRDQTGVFNPGSACSGCRSGAGARSSQGCRGQRQTAATPALRLRLSLHKVRLRRPLRRLVARLSLAPRHQAVVERKQGWLLCDGFAQRQGLGWNPSMDSCPDLQTLRFAHREGSNLHFVHKTVLRQISCCQVKQVWKILIQRSRSEARPYILLLIHFILLFRPSISPLLIEYFMAFLMGEMSRWTLFTKLTTSP